jgi:hypothetical protein
VSLSAVDTAKADAAVRVVRGAFNGARERVHEAASGWLATDAAKAVRKQFDDQAARAETWATSERALVERGQDDFAKWLSFGELYARFAAGTVKDAYNATVFAVAKDTVSATVSDSARLAATVANPLAWPAGVKLAVVAVVLVAVLYVATPYLRAARVVP